MIIDERNSAEPTNRYLGECPACELPIGREEPDGSNGQFLRVPCPACGRALKLERLFALVTSQSCDPDCMGAIGAVCNCGCGGANHGKGWVVSSVRDIPQADLEAYRTKRRAQRESGRLRRAPSTLRRLSMHQQWLEEHADLIAAMAHLTRDRHVPVLSDMLAKAEQKPLTLAQVDCARGLVESIPRDAWEEAHFLPPELVQGAVQHYVGILNNPVTVTGIVTKVHWMDDDFGGRKVLINVQCTGQDAGALVMFSSGAKALKALRKGDAVTITGVVNKQEEYKSVMQTKLRRVTLDGKGE